MATEGLASSVVTVPLSEQLASNRALAMANEGVDNRVMEFMLGFLLQVESQRYYS